MKRPQSERPVAGRAKPAFEVAISVQPCHGGPTLLNKLFQPFGYELETTPHVLDDAIPQWGNSPYYTQTPRRNCPLEDFMTHLYVLIPVRDKEKHYFVDQYKIEKLLRFGEGWLADHPEKELITRRHLKYGGVARGYLSK